MLSALVIWFSQATGRQIHPVYGFPNSFLISFLVTIPALLLVLPNVLGALAANRFRSNFITFTGVFIGAVLISAIVEARIVNSFFRTTKLIPLGEWKLWAVMLADVVVLLGVAAWNGRGTHA